MKGIQRAQRHGFNAVDQINGIEEPGVMKGTKVKTAGAQVALERFERSPFVTSVKVAGATPPSQ